MKNPRYSFTLHLFVSLSFLQGVNIRSPVDLQPRTFAHPYNCYPRHSFTHVSHAYLYMIFYDVFLVFSQRSFCPLADSKSFIMEVWENNVNLRMCCCAKKQTPLLAVNCLSFVIIWTQEGGGVLLLFSDALGLCPFGVGAYRLLVSFSGP